MLLTSVVFPQKKDQLNPDDYILIKTGDTLNIDLEEVKIFPKHKFSSREDINYYLWFRRKVFKAYPFAKLASERIDSLNLRLSRIKSKRRKKRYTKHIQKYVEAEFTSQIKKLTRTEGRILIKLIHRQTGKTAFQNIKGYRSGWKAFWYNATANLFKLSLKSEYHPETENEDYLIEDVLQRAFAKDNLVEQESKLNLNFEEIIAQKKGVINVDKYKEMFSKKRKKKKSKRN